MICVLAGNYKEARYWASGQNLEDDEWFYPADENDLSRRKDFHVVVIGSAGDNVPAAFFEKIYQLAKSRGRMK
jgi:hypothetical protein